MLFKDLTFSELGQLIADYNEGPSLPRSVEFTEEQRNYVQLYSKRYSGHTLDYYDSFDKYSTYSFMLDTYQNISNDTIKCKIATKLSEYFGTRFPGLKSFLDTVFDSSWYATSSLLSPQCIQYAKLRGFNVESGKAYNSRFHYKISKAD